MCSSLYLCCFKASVLLANVLTESCDVVVMQVLDKSLAKASAFKKRMEATERELRAKTHAYNEQAMQLLYTMRQLENVQVRLM